MDPRVEIQKPVPLDNAGKNHSEQLINILMCVPSYSTSNFISLGEETNAVMYGQEKELIFAQPIAKYSSSHIESILLILNNASTLA